MSKMRVLLVENDPAFLKTRKWELEAAGYDVLCATTPHKAKQILKTCWVHLAIVDLRLADNDANPADFSGLAVVRETDSVIPKIILTAFTDWHSVREALKRGGAPAPAADFLSKQEGPQAMLSSVDRVLRDLVRINGGLSIAFRGAASFAHLLARIGGERASGEKALDREREMEDLFRKVFYEHTYIYLHNLSADAEGITTMLVRAVSSRGTERFAVKCGLHRDISAAKQQTSLRHVYEARTLRYGAVAYHMNSWQRMVDVFPQWGKVAEFVGNVVSLLSKVSGG